MTPPPKHGTITDVPQRLYKTEDVAKIFAVDPKTVTLWANAGRLGPVIRTPGGRHRRYDADLVDRLATPATVVVVELAVPLASSQGATP